MKNLDDSSSSTLCQLKHALGDGAMSLMTWRSVGQFNADIMQGQVEGATGACGCGIRNGHRLHIGRHPITLYFKDKEDAAYRKDGRVYFQIDGEYFVVRYPKQVHLSHQRVLNVLDNRSAKIREKNRRRLSERNDPDFVWNSGGRGGDGSSLERGAEEGTGDNPQSD